MDNNFDISKMTKVSILTDQQMQDMSKMFNSQEYQNYAAYQVQEQIRQNLGLDKNMQFPKNQMVKEQERTNELISQANDQILKLQNQLNDSKIQLKQANDKISSQNLYIKELKADLKEEIKNRALVENKLNSKDWKTALIALMFSLIVLGIEHCKDIINFISSLF